MARKSKEFHELLYQESLGKSKLTRKASRKRPETETLKQFKQELLNDPSNEGKIFLNSPEQLPKISEQLIEFVSPFLEMTEDYEDRLMLFELAVLAWNLSLLPKKEREDSIQKHCSELFNILDPKEMEVFGDFQELLKELVENKLEFFPEDKRSIQDFKLTEKNGRLNLSVASSFAS